MVVNHGIFHGVSTLEKSRALQEAGNEVFYRRWIDEKNGSIGCANRARLCLCIESRGIAHGLRGS